MKLALVAATALSAIAATPAPPDRYLTDRTGLLSAPIRETLDRRLEDYARESGHQLVVYIDATTGGVPLEEWAVKTFEAWGIGKKGEDDGVALFIFTGDRRARIETGYGMEDEVPDAAAARILSEILLPGLKAGQADRAVPSAVDALIKRMGGSAIASTSTTGRSDDFFPRPRDAFPVPGPESTDTPRGDGYAQPNPLRKIIHFALIALILFLIIRHPRLALFFLASFGGRSGGGYFGGGGGGGSGGFSGGGGRSGGGGASGSW